MKIVEPRCADSVGVGMSDKCATTCPPAPTGSAVGIQLVPNVPIEIAHLACFQFGPRQEDVQWWYMMKRGHAVKPLYRLCGRTIIEGGRYRYEA